MPWIFGSFLGTPCALTSCHAVISKTGQSGTTGVQPERVHAMRTTQSDLDRVQRIGSRVRDTQSVRGVSDEFARGCKRWHHLAPGRRFGKKSSL